MPTSRARQILLRVVAALGYVFKQAKSMASKLLFICLSVC